jgi:hypothetical protein
MTIQHVVRCGPRAASGIDRVADGAPQSGLVALDLQQVVGASLPGDLFRGVVLNVRGIGGDDRIHQVDGAKPLFDLRDLSS